MGLFRKDNRAEKKLKELTGGFILSTSFSNLIKSKGLKIEDGINIKNQIKEEIKRGKINEFDVETRLNHLIDKKSSISEETKNAKKCPECGELQQTDNKFCIKCGNQLKSSKTEESKIKCPNCNKLILKSTTVCPHCLSRVDLKKICPICNKKQNESNIKCINCGYNFVNKKTKAEKEEIIQEDSEKEILIKIVPENIDFTRKTRFLNIFDHNLKTCPECNTKFLKTDPYCFNCGSSVLTKDTVKNDNIEIKNGKLVEKTNPETNDELSNLEALYNQTVQSKYAPDFKAAYILYLEHIRVKPSKKFSDKIAKDYETTPNKLKKQAIEDKFIEPASPLSAAKEFKVSDLKEILKDYGLKVSGKKDELIERLGENLSDDELKKHFKSKNYQISDDGLEFLKNNSYILYILNDKDISNVVFPVDFAKIFEEKHYSQKKIYEKLITYLKNKYDKILTNNDWGIFKIYSNAIAQILEDNGDLNEALKFRFKVFIFDLNNYSTVIKKPEPARTKLKQKEMVKLTRLMHNLTLPVDELKELFDIAYNEILFETVITSQDSLIYLLKVFGGENLDNISNEINEKYSNPY